MSEEEFTPIEVTLRRSAAALQSAGVPFVLGGSLAGWARGGPRPHNDVDLIVAPEDAEAALAALIAVDMREERPPEDWLVKVHDGDVCVDVIFALSGVEVDRDYVARAESPYARGFLALVDALGIAGHTEESARRADAVRISRLRVR